MRLIDSDQPLHRSAAANRAMDCADGAALLLLDDDDWLDADHLHKLATALQERPDAAAAVTGTRGVDTDGVCIHQWNEPALGRLMLVNQMPIMSVLFRKNTTGSAPRFDTQFDLFEDWDFWLQLLIQGKFVNVPGVSATYLIRNVNGSGVHEIEPSRLGQAKLRDKWRGRWPDAWLDALRMELEKGSQQTHTLRSQLNDVIQQREALQVTAEGGEQERLTLQAQLGDFTHQRDILQIAVNDGEQEHLALRTGLDSTVHLLDASRYELKNLKQYAADLQSEFNDNAIKLDQRDVENTQLVAEKGELIQRLAVQRAEYLARIELADIRDQENKIAANTTLELLKKQSFRATHELLLARQKLREQSAELARLKHIEIETSLRIQTLLDSTSWRVMAPMRSLSSRIRKLRGL